MDGRGAGSAGGSLLGEVFRGGASDSGAVTARTGTAASCAAATAGREEQGAEGTDGAMARWHDRLGPGRTAAALTLNEQQDCCIFQNSSARACDLAV